MKEKFDFIEGQYIYCSKIPGIHKIVRVGKNGEDRPPTLTTEHLYNDKYEKINAKARDKEYTIDGAFCKPIDFLALYNFELLRFNKVVKMIDKLVPDLRIATTNLDGTKTKRSFK